MIEAIKHSAFDYLLKPVDKEELLTGRRFRRDQPLNDHQPELHAEDGPENPVGDVHSCSFKLLVSSISESSFASFLIPLIIRFV